MARRLAEHARHTLRKGLRRVREGGGSLVRGRDEDLHALRVALKRLRYNLECFRGMVEDEAKDALGLLALGQERLGAISDDDAFARSYAALLADLAGHDHRRPGINARLRIVALARERDLSALRAMWEGGAEGPYLERLAGSISDVLGSLSNVDS
jgi:CHAD domain-containing protein